MGRVTAWFRARFHAVPGTVQRGYAVWAGVGLTIAIPEAWAAFGDPPWPTISGTIGHLETLWSITAVIVVAVVVVITANAVRLYGAAALSARLAIAGGHPGGAAAAAVPEGEGDGVAALSANPAARVTQADGLELSATEGGWVTSGSMGDELSPFYYFPIALGAVVGGCLVAAAATDDKWVLAYVIYGLIGVCFLVVPSLLAYSKRTRNPPFASLFATVLDLQGRLHFVTLVLLAGLIVLLIHLALYPWPDVFRHQPTPSSP